MYEEDETNYIYMMDTPFYNIMLNIEELCVDNFELDVCGKANKVIADFYSKLKKDKRRNFTYLENQIKN